MSTNQATFAQLLEQAVSEPGIVSRAYSAFHGYSIGNQLLALMQCMQRGIAPGPIATFPAWKAKGRYVRKGEKALTLCMPLTYTRRPADDASVDDSEPETIRRFVFRSNWFTIAQTEGTAVEPLNLPEWCTARALASLNITEIPFDHTDGNCQGYACERTIAVSPVAALPHKTRFHEAGHVVLGHTSESATLTDDERTPRSLREVEAESVALLCCAALNLPGADESRGYIQHWNSGADPIAERSAQRIFKAADAILRAGATEPKE